MVAQNTQSRSLDQLVAELAALWGVQTGYRDTRGTLRESPRHSVVQVLDALGAGREEGPLAGSHNEEPGGPRDERRLRRAIELRKADLRSRLIEPVIVAWDGLWPSVGAREASSNAGDEAALGRGTFARERMKLTLLLDGGGEERWEMSRGRSEFGAGGPNPGEMRRTRLPLGYHKLRAEAGGRLAEATVISAPRRGWTGSGDHGQVVSEGSGAGKPARPWGIFAPVYALQSERNCGAGDLADLEGLLDLVASEGGDFVATLPLLAGYLEHPFEPVPYSPVSRLFWNEFYLALEQVPEWKSCASAQAMWHSGRTQERLARLRAEPLVDYAEVMAVKRRVLEELCRDFWNHAAAGSRAALAGYVEAHPDVLAYAAFRARVEALGEDWRSWPDGEGAGLSAPKTPADLPEAGRYHLYCQWQMEEQLARLSGGAATTAREDALDAGRTLPGLFLDLPVGVHAGGFDTWRWRESFVSGMSAGAPPDSFFTQGQRWDSPPLHPERIREQGHSYFVGCLRQNLRHARYLRVDHVMSLHRLFWVPEGREPAEGVYMSYPADEMYAVLCLESHRHQAVVVGEDLGTVPPGVRASMRRHGLLGTWVLQSALRPQAGSVVGPVPRHAVAGLGTHDMFPFAGFLRCRDIDARLETGQVDSEGARRARAARRRLVPRLAAFLEAQPVAARPVAETPAGMLRRVLAYLGASRAALVMVNLEDMLLETRPQNLPGTGPEQRNWRRKVAGSSAEIARAVARAARALSPDSR